MAVPARMRPSPGAAVLALAVPLIFLHAAYNPGFDVGVDGTSVGVQLSDLALLAVGVATLMTLRAQGSPRLANTKWVWISTVGLLVLAIASTLWGPLVASSYPFARNLVSVATFVEYAILVPGVVVLVRSRVDATVVTGVLVVWTAVAATVGVLQIIGLVGNLDHVPAGRRMPSFLGYHEFAALGGSVLGLAAAAIALGFAVRRQKTWVTVAAAAGIIGVAIGGASATAAGLLVGAALTLVIAFRRETLTARRGIAISGMVALAIAGTLALRVGPIGDFIGFLGQNRNTAQGIETYSQRTVLSYIGLRIFLGHPVYGVGWQGSSLEQNYAPYLPAARRRFPDVSPDAFPSPQHPWGVQNAYIQGGADMGFAGPLLLVAVILTSLTLAVRSARSLPGESALIALAAASTLLICAFELAALGLVSASPIDALLWLSVGAAVGLRRVGRPDA